MDNIKNAGHNDVGDAIKALTEAVIKSTELEHAEKEQVVEELAFLAEQATLPPAQRQKSVIGMVLKAIPVSLATVADLTRLWASWEPTLKHVFK